MCFWRAYNFSLFDHILAFSKLIFVSVYVQVARQKTEERHVIVVIIVDGSQYIFSNGAYQNLPPAVACTTLGKCMWLTPCHAPSPHRYPRRENKYITIYELYLIFFGKNKIKFASSTVLLHYNSFDNHTRLQSTQPLFLSKNLDVLAVFLENLRQKWYGSTTILLSQGQLAF